MPSKTYVMPATNRIGNFPILIGQKRFQRPSHGVSVSVYPSFTHFYASCSDGDSQALLVNGRWNSLPKRCGKWVGYGT